MRPPAALRLARPFTLLAPVVGTASGALVARGAVGAPWQAGCVAAALAAAALATAASNAWNQAFDAPLDRVDKPRRPIPAGEATARDARRLGHALAAGALLAGALAGLAFLGCVVVGLAATWLYSAPPARTKRLPVGALVTIAVPRGLLVPVAGWSVLATPWAQDPWALGAITGLFVLGAAATKDFSDVEGDRAHGCRTLPVVLGRRRAARLVAPFLVGPFALYPVFGALDWLTAPDARLLVLAAALALGGGVAAVLLVRAPEGRAAWAAMYLLMAGSFVGNAVVYVA